MIDYGFTKELNIPYETLIRQLSDELQKEGNDRDQYPGKILREARY
ncbi:MAG: hypothetical protein ABFD50_20510 [Smithella sp.]